MVTGERPPGSGGDGVWLRRWLQGTLSGLSTLEVSAQVEDARRRIAGLHPHRVLGPWGQTGTSVRNTPSVVRRAFSALSGGAARQFCRNLFQQCRRHVISGSCRSGTARVPVPSLGASARGRPSAPRRSSRAPRAPPSPACAEASASASNSIPPPWGASRVQLRSGVGVAPRTRAAVTSRTIPVRSWPSRCMRSAGAPPRRRAEPDGRLDGQTHLVGEGGQRLGKAGALIGHVDLDMPAKVPASSASGSTQFPPFVDGRGERRQPGGPRRSR